MTLYSDRQDALKKLKEIDLAKKDYLVIHYACESFYEENGKSPRIICISVRQLLDGQTKIFSITQMAELKNIAYKDIKSNLDTLEKELLKRFFKFVKTNAHMNWIHWSMRDHNYGFNAIDHRSETLKIKPESIDDSKKVDFAWLLVKIYGKNYAPKSKMKNLLDLNNINQRDFLSGEDEASAIKNGEYQKINMSTASKVELFSHYFSLAADNKLKTNSKKIEIYGDSLKGKFLIFKYSWYGKLTTTIFTSVFWIIIGILIEKLFF
ncbi:hypothetical protein MX630_04920 [Carnobacterium divergens]|uniref:hypothetical protein n=1 Tax=Carnobacterium divergens TaxID=2748 RepID=UPI002891EA59|nr:hypothetical protein [Carnobacterium divergens]MDT1950084.1 hypothetical protein [Carnobacterium divergens]MDT1955262.1 hypothetical protein [Carnobacterium divergens]MDT1960500.1 hypothetical protein [Carnobacterium divergens]MDT1963044.1 hypothetical protein [Carnobacterium divergens]